MLAFAAGCAAPDEPTPPVIPSSPPTTPAAGGGQVDELEADKAARGPAQRKIDSNLLVAARQQAGEPIALQTGVVVDPSGRALVDVSAPVTPDLLATIESVGGTVVAPAPRYDSVRAWVPLAALEGLAARAEVRVIAAAAQATTN